MAVEGEKIEVLSENCPSATLSTKNATLFTEPPHELSWV
jgi:hypothetical protein